MPDRHRQPGRVAKLEALDLRDEAAERDQAGGPWAVGAQPEGVGHHGALREPAQDQALGLDAVLAEQLVQPPSHQAVRRLERIRVGEPDLADHVPVPPAGREGERPAHGHAEQPPLGVQRVDQRKQVVLVGRASVEEDERSLGIAVGGSESLG